MARPRIIWSLDLGNTRCKLGRVVHGVLAEVHTYARRDLGIAMSWLLTQDADSYAMLATGADTDMRAAVAQLEAQARVWSYQPGGACPLTVKYASPQTLGTDRLAAAVGAQALYPGQNLLVVDLGTCITYEYVSAQQEYLGGNISPGVRMRLRAMHAFSAKLPLVQQVLPEGEVGISTTSALQNGALRGAAHEVNGWVRAFRKSHPDAQVVVCGGDAPPLRPLLTSGLVYRSGLVLEGLAILYSCDTGNEDA